MVAIVLSTLASCSARAGDATEADCPIEDGELFVLMAQSVPSATLIPCIEALPAGWAYGGSDVSQRRSAVLARLGSRRPARRRGLARRLLPDHRGRRRHELHQRGWRPRLSRRVRPAPVLGEQVLRVPRRLRDLPLPVRSRCRADPRSRGRRGGHVRTADRVGPAGPGGARSDAVRGGRTPLRERRLACSRTTAARSAGRSVLLGAMIFVFAAVGRHPPKLAPTTTLPFVGEFDLSVFHWMDDIRNGVLTFLARFLNVLGSGIVTIPLRIAVAVVAPVPEAMACARDVGDHLGGGRADPHGHQDVLPPRTPSAPARRRGRVLVPLRARGRRSRDRRRLGARAAARRARRGDGGSSPPSRSRS